MTGWSACGSGEWFCEGGWEGGCDDEVRLDVDVVLFVASMKG